MATIPESPINLEVRLNREFLPVEKEGILFLSIKISPTQQAEQLVRSYRPKVHLVFSIDTSGSMAGEKIETAKKAAEERLNRDLDNGDYVSMVTFSESANAVVSLLSVDQQSKQMFGSQIRDLEVGSLTNLYDGLKLAGELANRSPSGYLRRILLLTDGNPTTGVMSRGKIVSLAKDIREKYKATIDVIGIGDDYDPDLTRDIALASGGSHYHASKPSEIRGTSQTAVDKYKRTILDVPPPLMVIPVSRMIIEKALQVAPEIIDITPKGKKRIKATSIEQTRLGEYQFTPAPISVGRPIVLAFKIKAHQNRPGRTELAKIKFGSMGSSVTVEFTNDFSKLAEEKDPIPRLLFMIGSKINELNQAILAGDESLKNEIEQFINKLISDGNIKNVIRSDPILLTLVSKFQASLTITDERTKCDILTKPYQ